MSAVRTLWIAALIASAIPRAGAADVKVVGAAEVHATMVSNARAVVIDARTRAEYEEAHIPGAISVPADEVRASAARLPRDHAATLVFYCRGAG